MLAFIYTVQIWSDIKSYSKSIHFFHAVLQQGNCVGNGFRNLLSSISRLKFTSKCSHLNSESFKIQSLLSISNYIFSINLCIFHVTFIQSLTKNFKNNLFVLQQSFFSLLSLKLRFSMTTFQVVYLSSLTPWRRLTSLALLSSYPLKSTLVLDYNYYIILHFRTIIKRE